MLAPEITALIETNVTSRLFAVVLGVAQNSHNRPEAEVGLMGFNARKLPLTAGPLFANQQKCTSVHDHQMIGCCQPPYGR